MSLNLQVKSQFQSHIFLSLWNNIQFKLTYINTKLLYLADLLDCKSKIIKNCSTKSSGKGNGWCKLNTPNKMTTFCTKNYVCGLTYDEELSSDMWCVCSKIKWNRRYTLIQSNRRSYDYIQAQINDNEMHNYTHYYVNYNEESHNSPETQLPDVSQILQQEKLYN